MFFLSVLHALHDSFRKLRSFVFVERISEFVARGWRLGNVQQVDEGVRRSKPRRDGQSLAEWRAALEGLHRPRVLD